MSQKMNSNNTPDPRITPEQTPIQELKKFTKMESELLDSESGESQAANLFSLARQALRNGNLENSRHYCEKALEAFRGKADPEQIGIILNFYANILLKLEDYEIAIQAFSESVSTSPTPAVIYNQMGLICEKLDRLPEASSYFLQALQLAPRNVEIRENFQRTEKKLNKSGTLTICMLAFGDLSESLASLENITIMADEIVLITPENPQKFDKIRSELKTSLIILQLDWQTDRAQARNEALKHAKGDWIIWLDTNEQIPLGDQEIIRNLVSAEKNKAFYFHVYQAGTENQVWLQLRMFPNLSGIRFERPCYEDISMSASNLGLHLVNSGVKITQIQSTPNRTQSKVHPEINEKLKTWTATHTRDYFSQFVLGLMDYQSLQFSSAIQHFENLIENSECEKSAHLIHLYALIFKAKALIAIKSFKPAVALLTKAKKLDDRHYLIYLTLGEVYTELKLPEKAMNFLRKCTGIPLKISVIPLNLVKLQGMWYFLVGRNWVVLKNYDQAILHFKKARMFLPNCSNLLRAWAQCYREMKKFKEALALMESALILAAEDPLTQTEMGYLCIEMNRLQQAETHFKSALRFNKHLPEALCGLALACQLSGEIDRAIQILQRITRINPKNPDCWIQLGYLYIKQDQIDLAESAFLASQKIQVLPLNAVLALSYAYACKGKFSKLLLTYCDVLKMLNGGYTMQQMTLQNLEQPSKMAGEFLNLAIHLMAQANQDGASFALETAILLAPEQHKISAMLADLYYTRQDFTHAVHLLEKLVLKEPQNSAHLRKLGDCYQKMKIDNAAKMCYWRARELDNSKNSGSQRLVMDG